MGICNSYPVRSVMVRTITVLSADTELSLVPLEYVAWGITGHGGLPIAVLLSNGYLS